ncbi:MAG: trypsin-like serine protease [Myxococcus sp.]|nr:trypsin-like serine protease [Myxococcus sp.]
MKAQVLSTVLAGTVLVSACGQVDLQAPASAATSQQEIIGGAVTMGDPAVVALVVGFGGRYSSYCTGSLIGPKTVLTAAHCIYAQGRTAPYSVAFGTYASSPTSVVRVVGQVAHPRYSGQSNDFGLLQLERAVTNVPVVRLNEATMPSSLLGVAVRHSGFGVTDGATQTGGGTKREVSTPLRRIGNTSFESGGMGKQTCQGDSGGPAFMVFPGDITERQVGVVSYGDQGCQSFGVDMRVDTQLPWIRTTKGAWEEPTCESDGLCKPDCAVIDQDCACATDGQCTAECLDLSTDTDCPRDCGANGVCAINDCPRADPDCVDEGGLCTLATQCRGRQCVNDSQNTDTYCSRSCTQNADCASPMQCASGACRLPLRPERRLLESCTPLLDFCVTSTCNGPQRGITRCVTPCTVGADCGAREACEGGSTGGRYCRPLDLDFQPKVIASASQSLGEVARGCSSAPGGLWAALVLMVPLLRRRRVSP